MWLDNNVTTLPEKPNVVVILLDTLRPDYLELYGFPRETAPFLNQLGETSAVFDQAYSTSSWTAPATASLFTGLYPPQHGVQVGFLIQQNIQKDMWAKKVSHLSSTNGESDSETPKNPVPFQLLSDEFLTLPEVFHNEGYTTYGFTTNLNISTDLNFDQGFDYFRFENMAPAERVFEQLRHAKNHMNNRKPYFLYLHFLDPHAPYHPREPYFVEQTTPAGNQVEAYLSELRYLDRYLEKIFDELNLHEQTLVILLSDHGEEFADHGNSGHGPTLYRELNQVLMMAYGPSFGIRPGRFQENVSLIDVLPTMQEFLDVPFTESSQGISLLPMLRGGEGEQSVKKRLQERTLFAHRVRADDPSNVIELWAAIGGNKKIIDTGRGETRRYEAYDLKTDIREQNNLYDAEELPFPSLLGELKEHQALKRHTAIVGFQEVDEELQETLEALGYIE